MTKIAWKNKKLKFGLCNSLIRGCQQDLHSVNLATLEIAPGNPCLTTSMLMRGSRHST